MDEYPTTPVEELKRAIVNLHDKAILRCVSRHRYPSAQIPCAECVAEISKEAQSTDKTFEREVLKIISENKIQVTEELRDGAEGQAGQGDLPSSAVVEAD